MDEPLPDQDLTLSLRQKVRRHFNQDDRESGPLNWLITIGTLLTLALLLLILMQFASVDPLLKFGLLLLGLGIAGIILVRRSYFRASPQPPLSPAAREVPEAKSGLQSTVENLDLAFKGDKFRQMLALEELKELLIERLALRKRLSRSDVTAIATDPIWLEAEVGQAELRWLLAVNLRGLYAPALSGSSKRTSPIADFPNYYRRILELLEEM